MSGFSHAILPRELGSDAIHRRMGSALRRWWLAYIDWRLQTLAIRRLCEMSDRELKDVGICRSQIEFAVGGRAERRPWADGC